MLMFLLGVLAVLLAIPARFWVDIAVEPVRYRIEAFIAGWHLRRHASTERVYR